MKSMYAEVILDNYRNPMNFGEIKDAEIKYRESNPLCGDEYEFHLKVNDGKIEDVKFSGDGCAISKASASLLSEKIKEKNLSEVKKMKFSDVVKILGIEVGVARIKCALLPLVTVQKGIQKFEENRNEIKQ